MEPIESAPSVKTPPRPRQIRWLGGAIFGRTPRENETVQERHDVALWMLALIAVAMVGTIEMLNRWGPMPWLGALVVLTVLNVLWIKRYCRSAKLIFRIASFAMLLLALMHASLYIR